MVADNYKERVEHSSKGGGYFCLLALKTSIDLVANRIHMLSIRKATAM
jgi:hypothetical protein